jgi:hypothetical protein
MSDERLGFDACGVISSGALRALAPGPIRHLSITTAIASTKINAKSIVPCKEEQAADEDRIAEHIGSIAWFAIQPTIWTLNTQQRSPSAPFA